MPKRKVNTRSLAADVGKPLCMNARCPTVHMRACLRKPLEVPVDIRGVASTRCGPILVRCAGATSGAKARPPPIEQRAALVCAHLTLALASARTRTCTHARMPHTHAHNARRGRHTYLIKQGSAHASAHANTREHTSTSMQRAGRQPKGQPGALAQARRWWCAAVECRKKCPKSRRGALGHR